MEHHKDGIVTGQRSHNVRVLHVVQCEGGTLRHALNGAQHHDILSCFHMDDTFPENRAQLVGKVQLVLLHGHRIAIAALSGGFLYQMQLLDIPGNGGLCGMDAQLIEPLQQLLLGLNGFLTDDLQQLLLTDIFLAECPVGR